MTGKTDRELLKLAAKACGFLTWWVVEKQLWVREKDQEIETWWPWSPLDHDADALRLAVMLNIELRFHLAGDAPAVTATCAAYSCIPISREQWGDDKDYATRRAIVRTAAAIGESMK